MTNSHVESTMVDESTNVGLLSIQKTSEAQDDVGGKGTSSQVDVQQEVVQSEMKTTSTLDNVKSKLVEVVNPNATLDANVDSIDCVNVTSKERKKAATSETKLNDGVPTFSTASESGSSGKD